MKYAKLIAGLLASSLAASAADAAPVVWNLAGVTFADGGTATGSFTFDASTSTYSNWSIAVAGGSTAALPAYTYTNSNGGFLGASHSATMVDFLTNPLTRYLRLAFAGALTDAGGSQLVTNAGYECTNCGTIRRVVAGSVTTAATGAVPEPATWAMLLLGFGGLGYAMRRRQSAGARIRFA